MSDTDSSVVDSGTATEGNPDEKLRRWSELGPDRQIHLREAYGRYLDSQPPTCSMDTKIEQFRRWLASQGIDFDGV